MKKPAASEINLTSGMPGRKSLLFYNFDAMKKIIALILPALIFCSFLSGCRNSAEKSEQESTDLISIKTLGLAYLEEFKLDDAEKEFLRFIKLAPDDKLGYANLGLTYLRMGKYAEAKDQLAKAIEIDPKDPDIRLILATVYQMNDERGKAIDELKTALTFAPDHIKVLYDLTELYSTEDTEEAKKEREHYIRQLVDYAPENLVPRLNFIDILIRDGEFDKATEQLEIISKQFPEFPKEAADYYKKTLALLRKSDKENAIISFTIFHNYVKVTSPYQAGIMDLKGPGGSLIGFPLITLDQPSASRNQVSESIYQIIKYTDATVMAGLNLVPSPVEGAIPENIITCAETADYDGDGDIDIYAGNYDPSEKAFRHYLFDNELGRYTDISDEAGLKHQGNDLFASFADFDNDGFLDLFIITKERNFLYRNKAKGKYEDITAKAGLSDNNGGSFALFFDADQDGDLDIFEAGSGQDRLFRNNSDGTFSENAAKMGLADDNSVTNDAAFGDFDEDGDLDLLVIKENSGNILYSNQREGIFRNMTPQSGLAGESGSTSVTVGDFDNDGYLDLFMTTGNKKGYLLYRNLRNGKFEKDTRQDDSFRSLAKAKNYDAAFLDFDNDGFLDLFVCGESSVPGGSGLFLFHNDGKGNFTDNSAILPPEVKSGRKISVFDYNDDGDLDILLAGLDDNISLLRNDGGDNNHFIKMKLVGLRTGSAKNNFFGIGAKVELRAGDLYQTMVVTKPDIHFGIGSRLKADVIRITWTNGVPQNMFFPGSDQALIESQVLKGSCPFLYTWDGEKYEFAKDILWRSALGMPMGIMGGNTTYAFPDASDDYIKIPGDYMKSVKGVYPVQVTSELWETIYLDKLDLVAVDHPDSVDVFVAEQFTPPPFPEFKIYQVTGKYFPVSARDEAGNDVLSLLTEKDDKYVTGFLPGKYQGLTELHDLILDPGDQIPVANLYLFMQGWIFPTDASINFAMSQSEDLNSMAPVIQVINTKGEWETVIDKLGFPMGKDKTVIADLSGRILTADHRIRIRTNMEIYWDRIFFTNGLSDNPIVTKVLDPVSADIHYRGFSRSYRKGGRYGPHWFDYSSVEKGQKWRDLTGNYTRYGDVLALIMESDDKYIISNAGDEVTVTFPSDGLPELKAGWKRDFLIHSVGWVKDGDLNTATGNEVEPLPFHGMKSYPPSAGEKYPDDPDHRAFIKEYNTRKVTTEAFVNALRVSEKSK
jgi:tetratricopeptide (TPR) repeat protein